MCTRRPRMRFFGTTAATPFIPTKKNGNWYLNGTGGKKYFFCEGITWNLISSRLHLRYLPSGYVLDNGAPCALLNPCVDKDEMFFILAWGLSDLCNKILKTTINHTKNIQSKDFERLPYPFGGQRSGKTRRYHPHKSDD